MLIPIEEIMPNVNIRVPKTDNEVILKNLWLVFHKEPWFYKIYEDVTSTRRKSYAIKCKYQIDVDEQPSLFEGYQLKFFWEGKVDLTIEQAKEKFEKRYRKKNWFHSIEIINGKWLSVTLKSWLNVNHRFNYYENFPVQYGILPPPKEEELKNVSP